MSYYSFENNEKSKSNVDVKASADVTEKARKLMKQGNYKKIADINKESLAGGLGLGVAGYIYARSKGKNVLLYTGIATLIGYITFNLIFRRTILSKVPSQMNEVKSDVVEEMKEQNFEGKKKRVRKRVKRPPRMSKPIITELNGLNKSLPIIR